MIFMGNKLRIGILGCANIAEKYSIAAFKSLINAELVCIASRNPEKAKNFAQKHGIEPENYNSLIERKDIDVVYIPLPVGLHEEWVIKAANAGKHVICEKSLTHDLDSAKRMVEACRKNSVALFENFMYNFHPQHEKVLSLLNSGAIGIPFLFQGFYGFPPFPENDIRYDKELGGGSLNDAGCYTVFMSRKILQSEPVAVTCSLVKGEQKEVDVIGSALLKFPEGGSALIAFGLNQVYQNNYLVWGSKGLIRVNRAYPIPPNMKPQIEILKNENSRETITPINAPAANHFELSFQNFCGVVIKTDLKRINEAYETVLQQARVMEAMRISSREQRMVEMKEFG